MVPSPANRASQRSAWVEAANRTARVEVANSWSAISTNAALTHLTRLGVGAELSLAASRAAIDPERSNPSGSSKAPGAPGVPGAPGSNSTIDAATPRAVRVTLAGRRSARNGLWAPAITTAQRIMSIDPISGWSPNGRDSHGRSDPSGGRDGNPFPGRDRPSSESAFHNHSATASKDADDARSTAGTPR